MFLLLELNVALLESHWGYQQALRAIIWSFFLVSAEVGIFPPWTSGIRSDTTCSLCVVWTWHNTKLSSEPVSEWLLMFMSQKSGLQSISEVKSLLHLWWTRVCSGPLSSANQPVHDWLEAGHILDILPLYHKANTYWQTDTFTATGKLEFPLHLSWIGAPRGNTDAETTCRCTEWAEISGFTAWHFLQIQTNEEKIFTWYHLYNTEKSSREIWSAKYIRVWLC